MHSSRRLDRAFYDLLASEARLGSFVAIARGDIPVEHWFAMSRPYGAIGRRRALLSWTGTMFEYLMLLLFQCSYGSSLLDKSAREAVAIQIAYGRKHRAPWGTSECAFADLDGQRVKDGVITLNRELVKHRVLVRMGKPAPADWDAHLGVGVKANDYT